MRVVLKCLAASAVLALLGGMAFGADDLSEVPFLDEPPVPPDRLQQLEAELAALKARLDGLPTVDSYTADSYTAHPSGCGCQPSGLYTGYAFVFAKPFFTESVNYQLVPNEALTLLMPFRYDHELTPRVWLGYVGRRGLGVRARYWQFDHPGAPVDVAIPLGAGDQQAGAAVASVWGTTNVFTRADGQALQVTNNLEVHTADFDVTQRVNFWSLSATVVGGLRYARMRQDFRATISDPVLVPPLQVLASRRHFDGLGPTVAIELERPIGSRGLSLFAGARGSVLFGNADGMVTNLDLEAFEVQTFVQDADEVLGIGEVEVGLQWARQLAGGASLFVRFGYEGQLWHEAGSPSASEGDLGFEGFNLALGIDR